MLLKFVSVLTIVGVISACGGAPAGSSGTSSSSSSSTSTSSTGSSEGFDSLRIGSGSGSSFTAELGKTLVKGGGEPVWTIRAVVADSDGIAVIDTYTVNFTSPCVVSGLSSLSETSAATQAGRVSVTYTAGNQCTGQDTLTASLDGGGGDQVARVNLDIDAAKEEVLVSDLQIGSGSGESFASELSANLDSSGELPVWTIGAVVADGDGIAVTDSYVVDFSSPCVASGFSTLSQASVATQAGRASVTYTAGIECTGEDTITGSIEGGNSTQFARVDLNVDEARDGATVAPRMGAGTGVDFIEGQLIVDSSDVAAGGSAVLTGVVVDGGGSPITNLPIDAELVFSSPCVSNGLARFSPSPASIPFVGGFASITYTAQGCSGEDVVSGQYNYSPETSLVARATLDIATDNVLGVQFDSVSESLLAIAGIGGQETSVVQFRLVGAQGSPIVGEAVSFELSNAAGGAKLASGTESDVSDNNGFITTVIQSGTVNSTLRVIATHDATGIRGFSDDVTISTGIPVSRSFDLSYEPFNPAAADTNGVEVNITARVTDQFGNPPPDGTRVSFRSVEAGSVTPSCTLSGGACSVTWLSSGDRGAITPDERGRKNRVTVMGFMFGAEDYTDFNGNGFFDPSNENEVASIVDLGEPYVDQNEDGEYNPGEDFFDSFLNDGSGAKNESHDTAEAGGANYTDFYNGPCSSALRSDCPASEFQSATIFDSVVIVMSSDHASICNFGNLPDFDTVIDTSGGSLPIVGLEVCDINGNSMPAGTEIKISGYGGGLSYTVPENTTEPYSLNVILRDERDLSGTLTIEIEAESVTTVAEWQWRN